MADSQRRFVAVLSDEGAQTVYRLLPWISVRGVSFAKLLDVRDGAVRTIEAGEFERLQCEGRVHAAPDLALCPQA